MPCVVEVFVADIQHTDRWLIGPPMLAARLIVSAMIAATAYIIHANPGGMEDVQACSM